MLFPFPLALFPFPFPSWAVWLFLFPWDSHGNGIPMGFPTPMHTSSVLGSSAVAFLSFRLVLFWVCFWFWLEYCLLWLFILLSYKVLLVCTVEQHWSDGNDTQPATDASRKGRRKSDVTEEVVIDENTGTYASMCCFHHKLNAYYNQAFRLFWCQSHPRTSVWWAVCHHCALYKCPYFLLIYLWFLFSF